MMTDESLTTEAILDAFATAGRVLPRAALKQAADRWPEVGPALIAMLEAVAEGDAVTDRTEAILFFGIYLMAQASEIRAFRPLCSIAAHDAQIERLIGDGVTEDLPLILARTYDGDPAPLRMGLGWLAAGDRPPWSGRTRAAGRGRLQSRLGRANGA
jgi:hypothetical protein